MTTNRFFRPILTAIALPLALSACGSDDSATPAKVDAIAVVPPPAGQTWNDVASSTPEGGIVVGNPNAPIKLVEYASHTCPHCADFSKESVGDMEGIVNSGRVSYELRNQIHDGLDLTMALLVHCAPPVASHALANQAWANLQGIVTTAQANDAALQAAMKDQSPQRFVKIAELTGLLDFFGSRGVSREQATQCLTDKAKSEAIIKNSTTQSEELKVDGTPFFFLNGNPLTSRTWPEVKAALEQAGAR
ncbi:MAG: hypothetical protein RLZZ08_1493 [Pseudomonadota bacterium]|jgi:protein-disulfide isomerase